MLDLPDWRLDELAQDGKHDPHPAPARTIHALSGSSFAGRPLAEREWHVKDLIPAKTVTILSGDGGTGKSLLAAQLAVATAAGRAWIGRETIAGRAAYLSAEDDVDELHRRLVQITTGEGIALDSLDGLAVIPLAGEDAVLAAPGRNNVIAATPLWTALQAYAAEFRPALLILDTLADLFAGDENSRTQVRQFIGMLRGLAIKLDLAAVVLSHPSLAGMSSGSGSSGSTGWNNSVRSRLYLNRAMSEDGIEADPDLRTLTVKKSNYSRAGEEIRLRWSGGMFHKETDQAPGSFAAATAEMRAERVFLEMVASYTAEGRHVCATPSPTFAPALFAKDTRAKGIGKQGLTAAMNRLFAAKSIRIEKFGRASKERSRIVVAA